MQSGNELEVIIGLEEEEVKPETDTEEWVGV